MFYRSFLFFFFSPLILSFFQVLLQILPCFSIWTKIPPLPPREGNGQNIYPCADIKALNPTQEICNIFGREKIKHPFYLISMDYFERPFVRLYGLSSIHTLGHLGILSQLSFLSPPQKKNCLPDIKVMTTKSFQ